MVLEKTLESPLDSKEITAVNPIGNQPWIFIGRTDAEAETPILWPHDMKNWLIWKDPDAGKDWRWEEKASTEDEMVGWHHQLNGYEFEQALGVGDGQGSLACCSLWGLKELDTIEWLNWTELKAINQNFNSPQQHPPISLDRHHDHYYFHSFLSHISLCYDVINVMNKSSGCQQAALQELKWHLFWWFCIWKITMNECFSKYQSGKYWDTVPCSVWGLLSLYNLRKDLA